MRNNHSTPPQPVGYDALIARFGLHVLPHWHHSAVAQSAMLQSREEDGQVFDVYPRALMPKETLGGQLEFALKHDGVNLGILAALFAQVDPNELTAYVDSKPTGKYARRAWYLYEFLTGRQLSLADVTTGNYVDLLENEQYYTAQPIQIRRQRVNDNLLGTALFCPVVRRTKSLRDFERKNLPQKCLAVLADYPGDLLKRAMSYLYTKETRSSFEIENVKLDASRTERFVMQLVLAEKDDFFNKRDLIALQNRIVDERFRDHDYRQSQNYVGESIALTRQRVHYISPKPGDLAALMEGMYAAHQRMGTGDVHPVIHAAVVAFGFVFMHPFEDGNGRIHRFLIHNVLARRQFTPKNVIFPVSAVMLQNRDAYDTALESFSKPLLPLVEYEIDEQGRMVVRNETAPHYRYIDMTVQAEALFSFVEHVVEVDLVEELRFLSNYDTTKKSLQAIVDMPDRLIDLFIKLCLQNNGRISAAKRKAMFAKLTDAEVEQMQAATSPICSLLAPPSSLAWGQQESWT